MERKKPFTEFDKTLLTNLIGEFINIIDSKKTDALSANKKAAAWLELTEKFNSSSRISQKANPKQLKKFWSNLKAKAREAKTIENQRNYTGGGPPIPNMDGESEHVLGMLNTVLPVVKVVDSDAVEVKPNDDDDHVHWLHASNRTAETDKISHEELITEIIVDADERSHISPPRAPSTATRPRVQAGTRRKFATDTSGIESAKIKIMKQDLRQREERFQAEMIHLKIMNEIELNHKKEIYDLEKEEARLKIDILRKKLNKED